jgi:hypothetical protein
MVLSCLKWLAKYHPEWRNLIIVNAYFALSIYQNFYAIVYLHNRVGVEYLEARYPSKHYMMKCRYRKAQTSVEL